MLTMQKYEGVGNDYLILDPNRNELKLEENQIKMLCRRNFGVGADGILYGPLYANQKIFFRIFNPDGSEAERSGIGACIFAAYLRDAGCIHGKKVRLYSKAGENEVVYLEDGGMRVKMGKPVFACEKIPVTGVEDEIINLPLLFHGELYNATCVSVGNPNCVIMMEDVSGGRARELGPYVEHAARFPNRMNLQLCRVVDRTHIKIEIYERGTGYILASGTGACAAAAASYRMGLTDRTVFVEMPGGTLLVETKEDLTMYLTGSARAVGTFFVAEHFFA